MYGATTRQLPRDDRRAVALQKTQGPGGGGTRAVALALTWLGGRQTTGLERAWWRREMSDRARRDLVEGGTQAIVLELTVGRERSSRVRKGLVEAGDDRLCSNRHGWVGDE